MLGTAVGPAGEVRPAAQASRFLPAGAVSAGTDLTWIVA
jgi:hypothetical protein